MKVVIAGGTGFLGRPLTHALAADGHEVVILTRGVPRNPGSAPGRLVIWNPADGRGPWTAELEGAGAVVNLAGESIGAKRWSTAQKQRILDSRLQATRTLAGAIARGARPPQAFLSGSALGYYGPLGEEIVTEYHGAGSDFLATVCRQWESAAVQGAGNRT